MANYEMMKRTIEKQKENRTLDKVSWQSKLDVFLMFDRIDSEQYKELMDMLEISKVQI